MSAPVPKADHNVHRIHGSPEDWFREFVTHHTKAYEGRINGVCVHISVLQEGDEEYQTVTSWFDWPNRAHLIGHLTATITKLTHSLMAPFEGDE